jgi:hypothetical protein
MAMMTIRQERGPSMEVAAVSLPSRSSARGGNGEWGREGIEDREREEMKGEESKE